MWNKGVMASLKKSWSNPAAHAEGRSLKRNMILFSRLHWRSIPEGKKDLIQTPALKVDSLGRVTWSSPVWRWWNDKWYEMIGYWGISWIMFTSEHDLSLALGFWMQFSGGTKGITCWGMFDRGSLGNTDNLLGSVWNLTGEKLHGKKMMQYDMHVYECVQYDAYSMLTLGISQWYVWL
jgi:hypothetical protein